MRSAAAQEIAARTRAKFKHHRKLLLEYVRHLDALVGGCADMVPLDAAVLLQAREKLLQRADLITEQLKSRSWVYFGILEAASLAGTNLGYTSPAKGRPHGPGIGFLIAASKAHGYEIGPDRARDLLVIFKKLPRLRAVFGGAGEMVAVARVFKKDGDEVLDDANRPELKGQPGDELAPLRYDLRFGLFIALH